MSKEERATAVAKEIVEEIGKDAAAALVEYANLVKQLAADLTEEQLEDSSYIKRLLEEDLPNWDFDDWYELLITVRQKKRQEEHEEKTAEAIYNEMPYYAQAAAEKAVDYIIKAAKKNELFKANRAADQQVDILWTMFYCMGIDIKNAATNLWKKIEEQGYIWGEGQFLINFIDELREVTWKHGDIAKLRTKELR